MPAKQFLLNMRHLDNLDLPRLEVHLEQALEAPRVVQPRDQRNQKFLDLTRAQVSPSTQISLALLVVSAYHGFHHHYRARLVPRCLSAIV